MKTYGRYVILVTHFHKNGAETRMVVSEFSTREGAVRKADAIEKRARADKRLDDVSAWVLGAQWASDSSDKIIETLVSG